MQQRPESQRLSTRQLIGERLRQHRCDRAGVLAERPGGIALERDRLGEHRVRVLVHVEMVVAALLDSPQLSQLRQHSSRRAERIHQREPVQGALAGDDPLELGEHALGSDAIQGARTCARCGGRLGIHPESELADKPGQPERAQRVRGERPARDHPQAPGAEVVAPTEWVDAITASEWLGDRVDREVSLGQVGLDRAPVERQQVDLPGPVARDHAPGAEPFRQLEHICAHGAREPPRERPRVAGNRDIEVAGGTPQEAVAHGAADEPPGADALRQRAQRFAGPCPGRVGHPAACP